jgi:hypothetical protein
MFRGELAVGPLPTFRVTSMRQRLKRRLAQSKRCNGLCIVERTVVVYDHPVLAAVPMTPWRRQTPVMGDRTPGKVWVLRELAGESRAFA